MLGYEWVNSRMPERAVADSQTLHVQVYKVQSSVCCMDEHERKHKKSRRKDKSSRMLRRV